MMNSGRYFLSGALGDGARVRFALTGERISVGRQGLISIDDPSVSRNHAVLSWCGDYWLLTDAGSRNGTFVNGVAVQRRPLSVGDSIRMGKVSLLLEDASSDDACDDQETRVVTISPTTYMPSGPGALALVGRSDALRSAMRLAARAAHSDATVLLTGESGTGKELFARLVWEESRRKAGKFVPVHSGAIEPTLLASTLFGYEKGAFTGADKRTKGLFEEADGGTIFLDEIGEISADTQVKLLRVLQEGEFMRVGGTVPIKTDVRVVCATNRNLADEVKRGKFREDLYYRLNVIQINLPPLRERRGDIADLAEHFLAMLGGVEMSFSSEAMSKMLAYGWPGNVRELRNTVERMVVLANGKILGVEDLPPEIRDAGSEAPSGATGPSSSLSDVESRHIAAVLRECGGNKKLAAERLGISRSTLYERLRQDDECPANGHGVSDNRTDESNLGGENAVKQGWHGLC